MTDKYRKVPPKFYRTKQVSKIHLGGGWCGEKGFIFWIKWGINTGKYSKQYSGSCKKKKKNSTIRQSSLISSSPLARSTTLSSVT